MYHFFHVVAIFVTLVVAAGFDSLIGFRSSGHVEPLRNPGSSRPGDNSSPGGPGSPGGPDGPNGGNVANGSGFRASGNGTTNMFDALRTMLDRDKWPSGTTDMISEIASALNQGQPTNMPKEDNTAFDCGAARKRMSQCLTLLANDNDFEYMNDLWIARCVCYDEENGSGPKSARPALTWVGDLFDNDWRACEKELSPKLPTVYNKTLTFCNTMMSPLQRAGVVAQPPGPSTTAPPGSNQQPHDLSVGGMGASPTESAESSTTYYTYYFTTTTAAAPIGSTANSPSLIVAVLTFLMGLFA